MLGRQLESLIMKPHRLTSIVFAAALLAGAVPAFGGTTSLLTPKGIRYAIESEPNRPQIEIGRAEGTARATLVVPSTQDAATESQAQLAFDAATDTLYVVWVRDVAGNGEIRFTTLNSEGQWTTPRMVAAGSGMYRGLQLVLTHATADGVNASLMHLAWWSINGTILDPEYALFAFEDNHMVSAETTNLVTLAGVASSVEINEYEDTGDPIHPPLSMSRNEDTVDLAFGSVGSSSITLVNIAPRRIGGNVRIWKPLGRHGVETPKANLVSGDSTPVQAYLSKGHLALYTQDSDFRFVFLQNDGTWSPIREVHIDEDNTAGDLMRDLQSTVEELLDAAVASDETPAQSR